MRGQFNFRIILCWLGIHTDIAITAGNYIRCFICGKDHLPKFAWKKAHGWISHEKMLEYRKSIGISENNL